VLADARREALDVYRSFARGELALTLRQDGCAADSSTARSERAPAIDQRGTPIEAPSWAAVGLLSLLDVTRCPGRTGDVEHQRCIELLERAIAERSPLAVGPVLDRYLRNLDRVALLRRGSPISAVADRRSSWLDVALDAPHSPVEFIPLSIFTRRFFRHDLPALIGSPTAVDAFHYHRENDKATELRELHADLAACAVRFQYFIDASGLTEIVLDRAAIGRAESAFAAALFCRYNGIRHATLDGVPISLGAGSG